jgi:hypothetical protein
MWFAFKFMIGEPAVNAESGPMGWDYTNDLQISPARYRHFWPSVPNLHDGEFEVSAHSCVKLATASQAF